MENTSDRAAAIDDFERKIIKDKLRFAIGKPDGGHSGVWAAWNWRSDFYVGALGALGNSKISLHKSGCCRFAITKEAAPNVDPAALPMEGERAFVKWQRPSAPTEGAHLTLLLRFPTNYLRLPAPVGSAKKPLLVLEAARTGKATQLGFFFSREAPKTLEAKFLTIGTPIFHWGLPNGEFVWLVGGDVDFDPSAIPEASAWRNLRALDSTHIPGPQGEKNLNAILWNAPKAGEPLTIIEIGGLTVMPRRDCY